MLANSVDRGQTPRTAASKLGLHMFLYVPETGIRPKSVNDLSLNSFSLGVVFSCMMPVSAGSVNMDLVWRLHFRVNCRIYIRLR